MSAAQTTGTKYRVISHRFFFGSLRYYLQFELIIQRKKYFGVLGPVTNEVTWRFVPGSQTAEKEGMYLDPMLCPTRISQMNCHYLLHVDHKPSLLADQQFSSINIFMAHYPEISVYFKKLRVEYISILRKQHLQRISQFKRAVRSLT